jgi:uncharacterized coiled-coil protein SlyX
MEQGRESFADRGPLADQHRWQERISQLESLVTQQQALVSQQQAAIAAYQEQLERQHEQLVLLKRALFSSRRERYLPSPDQRLLFAPPPTEPAAAEDAVADAGDDEPPPAPSARPRGCRRGASSIHCLPNNWPARAVSSRVW